MKNFFIASMCFILVWFPLVLVLESGCEDRKVSGTKVNQEFPTPEIVSHGLLSDRNIHAESEPLFPNPLAGLAAEDMWTHLGEGVYEFQWFGKANGWGAIPVIWPHSLVKFIGENPDVEVTAISERTSNIESIAIVVTKKKVK